MSKLSIVSAAAALMLSVSSALAADLSVPYYKAPPPPPPEVTWTGCYVDAGGGYGLWNEDHFGLTAAGPFESSSTAGGRGWLGRVGAGCDYQVEPKWVLGVFGDYDPMDLHGILANPLGIFGGVQTNEKESSAWAAGGRIGYVLAPGVLTYFDGGFTETQFDQSAWITPTGAPSGLALAGQRYNGWFLGGGTETSLASWLPGLPAGLFLRTEYRYSTFGSENDQVLPNPVVPTAGSAENIKPYVQTITTSLVWRFNWGGPLGPHY
jgi:outer membrane immunogenic protein